MANKKLTTEEVKTIKAAQEEGRLVVGTAAVLRRLRRGGDLKQIYLSVNCPQSVREDVLTYARFGNTPVHELVQPNDELGTLAKKQYAISVIGIA